MLEVIKYIKIHGLEKTKKDFKLISRDYDGKFLLKYSQIDSNMSERIVQECRGLILEKDTLKILNLSFFKFFNSAESNAAKLDWDTVKILEKLDGSMISLYFDCTTNNWFASTTGTAEGEGEVNNKLGLTFNKLFWKIAKDVGLNTDKLVKGNSYVFELTSPYNVVVCPHTTSNITLLAARNLKTLNEYSFSELEVISEKLNVKLVNVFDISASNSGHVIKTLTDMPWHEEGYVLVDNNFNRIKIKNPAYIAIHHLKGKLGEHNILEIVKTNEIDEFIATFPERSDEIKNLKVNYDALNERLSNVWGELKNLRPKNITKGEKKRFASEVFKVCEEHSVSNFSGLFFNLSDGKVETISKFLREYDNKKLYKLL